MVVSNFTLFIGSQGATKGFPTAWRHIYWHCLTNMSCATWAVKRTICSWRMWWWVISSRLQTHTKLSPTRAVHACSRTFLLQLGLVPLSLRWIYSQLMHFVGIWTPPFHAPPVTLPEQDAGSKWVEGAAALTIGWLSEVQWSSYLLLTANNSNKISRARQKIHESLVSLHSP